MTKAKSKKYVRISTYGSIAVPIEMLESLVESGLLVSTTWENGKDTISSVNQITNVVVVDYEEIEAAIVQQRLSGES